MSKKRRKRPVATRAITDAKSSSVAKDGFVNQIAYLGEASPLSQANDYERHSISLNFELLTVLYRENWLAARIIDTPCEDITRSWYSLSTEIDQNKIDELKRLENKHSIKQEITNAIRWGRLYGGAAAVMVIAGQEDMLDQPIDYDMLQPGCFRGLIVVDRVRGIFPSLELEEDMDDVEFGYPKYYDVMLDEESANNVRIHHSRLLLFKGRQLPIDEEISADYWGASEIEHVFEELQKRNSSSANIAQLIFQANVAAMKISDYGEVLGMGTQQQREQIYRTITEMNRLRTSFGIALLGAEDSYEQHPYSFSGLSEVYETFMMDMAGAAEIPATKLFGRAPQGMNATGESDMKNYYEMISQLQERILRPALEKLLPVMSMSLWGEIPEDIEIVFEPLGTTTPSEKATIMSQAASPIIQAFTSGLISQKLALMELRASGKPINAWTNITDEDIENADDQPTGGEEMQDPMGMMMPGSEGNVPEEPQAGQEAAPNDEDDNILMEEAETEEQPLESEKKQEEDADEFYELRNKIIEAARSGDLQKVKDIISGYDGGPGSGPRPGYKKTSALHHEGEKAGMMERAKFLANPTAGMKAPAQKHENFAGNKATVEKQNKERSEWSDMGIGQKVQGANEYDRHVRKVRNEVRKAALKGDIEKAKAIVQKNRHYWDNGAESEMKKQSERLKYQKAAKPRFMHDLIGKITEKK